jgi:hypothetical protein
MRELRTVNENLNKIITQLIGKIPNGFEEELRRPPIPGPENNSRLVNMLLSK